MLHQEGCHGPWPPEGTVGPWGGTPARIVVPAFPVSSIPDSFPICKRRSLPSYYNWSPCQCEVTVVLNAALVKVVVGDCGIERANARRRGLAELQADVRGQYSEEAGLRKGRM